MLVCFTSIMHLLWSVLLVLNNGPVGINATMFASVAIPDYRVRAVCYVLAALTPLGLLRWPGTVWGLLCCLPQLLLLMSCGASAIYSITHQHYADGVIRPWTFIAMDQAIYVILAILYAFETLDRFHDRRKERSVRY